MLKMFLILLCYLLATEKLLSKDSSKQFLLFFLEKLDKFNNSIKWTLLWKSRNSSLPLFWKRPASCLYSWTKTFLFTLEDCRDDSTWFYLIFFTTPDSFLSNICCKNNVTSPEKWLFSNAYLFYSFLRKYVKSQFIQQDLCHNVFIFSYFLINSLHFRLK